MVRLVPIVKLEKEVFFGVIMLLFLIVRIEPSIAQLLLFQKNVPRYVFHFINYENHKFSYNLFHHLIATANTDLSCLVLERHRLRQLL